MRDVSLRVLRVGLDSVELNPEVVPGEQTHSDWRLVCKGQQPTVGGAQTRSQRAAQESSERAVGNDTTRNVPPRVVGG